MILPIYYNPALVDTYLIITTWVVSLLIMVLFILMVLHNRNYLIAAAILLVWLTLWKGLALWRAGRNNQPWWFMAMFIIQTLGLLEIIYLLLYPPRKSSEHHPQKDRS